MFTIAFRVLKDRKVSVIAYGIGMFLIVLLYAGMYPTILKQADTLEKFVEVYPEAFLEAFGIDDFRFDTIEKFLAVEYYSIFWPIAMIVLATGLAGSAIAREVENGTIEYALAKPIRRRNMFLGKYIGGLGVLFIFTLTSVFSIVPAAAIFGTDVDFSAQCAVFFMSLLFAMAVYSLAIMFSAMCSEKGRVSLAMSVIMIVMYVANVAASVVECIDWLKYASLFHYYNYDAALKESAIHASDAAVLAGVIIIAAFVGMLWFSHRDVAV